ncbi:hypothetical protein GC176_23250 [bacterium]|nr:hypothetical protein [bacterium]
MLIRTLVREWISGRPATAGRRAALCLAAALLAGAALTASSTAGELPRLETLLGKRTQMSTPVPARVQIQKQFDVVDVEWEGPAVAVEPSSPAATRSAKLEPIPASAADLIESIDGESIFPERLSRALPQTPSQPYPELQSGPTITHQGPILVQRHPAPPASAAEGGSAPRAFVLGSEEVKKLLTRARRELEKGDVAMAHAFAEAAAEREVPLALFEENSQLLIDEIEIVRSLQFEQAANEQVAAWQPGSQPVPDIIAESPSLENTIEQQPHVWRSLGGPTLSAAPPLMDRDGSRQELPEARGMRIFARVPQVNQRMGFGRGWEPISYSWEAPALKYNPLYFEDPQLERHGNEIAYVQPVVSAARFAGNIVTLPYQMATENNGMCHTVYDLGNDRPGTCVPYSIPLLPISLTGALAQGGAATALVFILP